MGCHILGDDVETEEISHKILREALENLSPVDRTILAEWAYGASFKAIGELIGKKQGTVKVAKHRALEKLREEYWRILASQENEIQKTIKARYRVLERTLS